MEGQFGGGRPPREDLHEEILDELLRGGSLDCHCGEWVIVAEPDEPGRQHAVCENGGLQGIGRGIADTRRVLPGTPPAKRRQHVCHGLQPGQSQTWAIPLVGERGEHPGAARHAEIDGVGNLATAWMSSTLPKNL